MTDATHGGAAPSTPTVAPAVQGHFRKVLKLLVLLREPAWRTALKHRVAAAVEHRAVPFGDHFATVVDIGAHHGQFALLIRHRYPSARLICVEPLPGSIGRLRQTVGCDPDVTIIETALAARPGRQTMHVSRKTDSSSLLPIMQPLIDAFPGTEEAATVEVPVSTLDDLVRDAGVARPALLKIDVQGGELDVLDGGTEALKLFDAVFVECSFVEFYRGQALADEVIARCLQHGLRLVGVCSVVADANNRCLQADLLFRR